MILETLVLGTLAVAVFDARLTARRIREYKVSVELNWHIKKLVEWLGVDLGTYAGVIIPTVLWVSVPVYYHVPLITAFYAGLKLRWGITQLESLMFEKNLKALAKEINEKGK